MTYLFKCSKLVCKRILLFVLITINVSECLSQDCIDQISNATDLYKKGSFKEVIEKLEGCTSSSDLQIQYSAYRLISIAYLELEQLSDARTAAIKMLEANPTYKPSTLKDPLPFIRLLNTITVLPKVSLGLDVSVGANVSIPKVTDVYSVVNHDEILYKGLPGFLLTFSSAYQFNKQLSGCVDLVVCQKKYEISYASENINLTTTEHLTYGLIPISLKYQLDPKWKIEPYAQLGFYTGFLLGSKSNFSSYNRTTEEEYKLNNISLNSQRTKQDVGMEIGAGFFHRRKNGQYFAQLTLSKSFRNIVNEDTRYDYPRLIRDYYYLDDDITLSMLSLRIGYSVFLNYKVLH